MYIYKIQQSIYLTYPLSNKDKKKSGKNQIQKLHTLHNMFSLEYLTHIVELYNTLYMFWCQKIFHR